MDLDAASATAVAQRAGGFGTFLKIAGPVGALCFAGVLLYKGLTPKSPTAAIGQEEFHTDQFPGPRLDAPRPQLDQGVIKIPAPPPPEPPAPVQPPTTLSAPPEPVMPAPVAPPAAVIDDGAEARRLAELERQRLAEEERQKWARLRAPQLVVDGGGAAAVSGASASASDASGASAGRSGAAAAEDDPNRRFLASASNAGADVAVATKNARTDALVAQGTTIRGVLETALQSDLPGMVRAITTEDVYSFDGRRVLIPSGTRLVGEYKSGLSTGQTRVFVVWTRLLRADGVSVQLGSNGTDDLGRAGNTGIIDNHYAERFGAAILLSIVGGGTQFLSTLGQSSTAALSATTATPTTQAQAQQIAAQQISLSLNNMAQEALKNSINIPPTIYLDQGARIIVFVRRDLDFSAFYPDPVKEALRELKRERGIGSDGISR